MALQYSAPGNQALAGTPFSLPHGRGLIMRFAILALAFLGLGGLELAAADPEPATPSAAPAAVVTDSAAPAASAATKAPPPPAASPAAASQPAAPKATTPALSADEQRLLSQGYKPQMRNGEKVYCRRETELGSRLGSVQRCGTVTQLKTATQNGRDYTDQVQRTQNNPMGH